MLHSSQLVSLFLFRNGPREVRFCWTAALAWDAWTVKTSLKVGKKGTRRVTKGIWYFVFFQIEKYEYILCKCVNLKIRCCSSKAESYRLTVWQRELPAGSRRSPNRWSPSQKSKPERNLSPEAQFYCPKKVWKRVFQDIFQMALKPWLQGDRHDSAWEFDLRLPKSKRNRNLFVSECPCRNDVPQSELPEQPKSSDHQISFRTKLADEVLPGWKNGPKGAKEMAHGSNFGSAWHIWHSTIRCRRVHQEFSVCCPYCFLLVALVFLHKSYILPLWEQRKESTNHAPTFLRSLQTSSPTGASLLDAMERLEKIVLDATELALRQSAAPGRLTCIPQVVSCHWLTPVDQRCLLLRYRSRMPSQTLQLRVFSSLCLLNLHLFVLADDFLTNLPMEPDHQGLGPKSIANPPKLKESKQGSHGAFVDPHNVKVLCFLSPVFSFVPVTQLLD